MKRAGITFGTGEGQRGDAEVRRGSIKIVRNNIDIKGWEKVMKSGGGTQGKFEPFASPRGLARVFQVEIS